MVLSHIEYGFTNWSFTTKTTLNRVESLYKRAIKILDKKTVSHHNCPILQKYGLLSFNNFTTFKYACATYKILKGLAPPPLSAYIKQKENNNHTTRATARGDCIVPLRRTSCGQTVLSVAGSRIWNNLPIIIRDCNTYTTFKISLKKWLLTKQVCDHNQR